MKALFLLICVFLTGCMVGPDYFRPLDKLPEKWENASLKSHQKQSLAHEEHWWKNYNDSMLNDLVFDTIASNYDLKTAFTKICQARAVTSGLDATLAPEIDAFGSAIKNANSLNTQQVSTQQDADLLAPTAGVGVGRNRYFNIYAAGLTTTWEIDLFGRIRRNIESAEATVEAQIEDMRNTLLSLISDVAATYMKLRGYQQQLAITQKLVEAWSSMVALDEDLLKAGLITDIDVSETKASRDQAAATVDSLKTNIKISMHQLAILVGKSPAHFYGVLSIPKPIPSIPSEIFAGLPSDLLRRRPDIREAERTLAAATAQIGVAEGSLFPIFSLTGSSVGYQSNLTSNLISPGSGFFSFGPSFVWPIMDFGRVRAKIDEATAMRDETYFQYKSVLLKALADVENALVSYDSEAKRLYALKCSNVARKYAADVTLARYKAGLINFIEVLQAEVAYQTNALTLAQSQTTLALNSVFLYKALGGGWQVDLNMH